MANWCRCSMSIDGHPEELKKLLKNANQNNLEFSLDKLFPSPNDSTGLEFRLNNWGTCYDLNDVQIEIYEDSINLNFESAWSPPIFAFDKISRDYPTLNFEFTFEEECEDFCGEAKFKNGFLRLIQDKYHTRFNGETTLDMDSICDKKEQIAIKGKIKFYDDPYDYNEKPINIPFVALFPSDTDSFEEDDLDDILFIKTKKTEELESFFEDNEKIEFFLEKINNSLDEIKKIHAYKKLNQDVPIKNTKKTTRKI